MSLRLYRELRSTRDSGYRRSTATTDKVQAATEEVQAVTDEGVSEGDRRIPGRSSKEYRTKYSPNSRLVEGLVG